MDLNVIGFGACMISGFPFPPDTGFLCQAMHQLHRDHQLQAWVEIVTMGGFPAQRAQKHLYKKVLVHRPDVVVLQFGSTDASAPLRRSGLVRLWVKKPVHGDKVSPAPATWKHAMKWRAWGVASSLLRVKPVAPLDEYLAAMDKMVKECLAAGSAVVVVSPFVMGSGHSNRLAQRYSRALGEKFSRLPNCYYLDAYSVLKALPRRQILLSDGFHLSARGHEVLGDRLGEILLRAVRPIHS